ncbi:glutathione S-transferase C-terminal-like protein [Sparassis latifolia]
MTSKQFTLYTHKTGTNGWKVAIVLVELGLSFDSIYLDFTEVKQVAHTKFNPNGRIPTLIDHSNNDFVVWESNAILIYLVEKYDKEHKISASSLEDKATQLQWLFFQASGQGAYFGQAAWFRNYHHEKIPSALERYLRETIRLTTVLESVLSKQAWLTCDKLTIADLSFIPWNRYAFDHMIEGFEGFNLEKDCPAVAAWHAKLMARPAVAEQFALKDALAPK